MRLSWLLAALVLLVGIGSTPAATPAPLKKLHILMVFDTNDEDLIYSLKVDEWRMERLIHKNIPASLFNLKVLKGKDVTADKILAYYKNLKVKPDEGLLFFYGGHGAIDPRANIGHYFSLTQGKVLIRSDLRKAMEAKKAAAVLIISDCCSTKLKIPAPKVPNKRAGYATAKTLHPTIKQVLFQARGTIDVTAATDNASWGDGVSGGLFTRSLCRVIEKPVKDLDVNKDGRVNWIEFFPILQKETEIVFKTWTKELKARGQDHVVTEKNQKPRAFSLGGKTWAIVGIENATGKEMTYKYRWASKDPWKTITLPAGEKKAHPLAVTPGTLPMFEAQFEGIKAVQKLKPGLHEGDETPTYNDGEQYRIKPRKKK